MFIKITETLKNIKKKISSKKTTVITKQETIIISTVDTTPEDMMGDQLLGHPSLTRVIKLTPENSKK